nr:DNA-protecting protein DprA [Desulfobulbaceae bacterium]
MDTILNWLTLHLTPGLGPAGVRTLLDAFETPARIFSASNKELLQVRGIKKSVVESLIKSAPFKLAEQELEKAKTLGVEIISCQDERYPSLLGQIYNPPVVLYVKGRSDLLNRPSIAVVGSRAATSYGLKIARQLSAELSGRLSIVSGLALGIDTAAHHGALEAGGSTIAVLGCSLDITYPPQNSRLARLIENSNGAMISEYPFQTKPDAFRFPARNRIISGMALGVLVVEAAERSGSLITARQALEEGREVFAIPGRVDSIKSSGTHRLLKEGAKLVHTIDDILEEFQGLWSHDDTGVTATGKRDPLFSYTATEQKIIDVLDAYPKHIDSIISETGLDIRLINESLLLLELKNAIEALPGQQYRCNVCK